MKKVFSLMMSLLLCFSFPVPASAKAVLVDVVQPLYEMANEATSTLSINGTTAACKSTTWTKAVYSNTITMSNKKSGLTSGKYRLKTVFTLTDKQGKTETITVYSDEKTVG